MIQYPLVSSRSSSPKTKLRKGHTEYISGAKVNKMKRKNQQRVRFVTLAAIIAALYVVLTLISAVFGLSSGVIQVRISEALCVLTFFTPAAIPGLTIGCLISNIVTAANILDIVFGTLATFLGAVGGYMLRKRKWLITLPTVLANTVIVPLVIVYGFGVTDVALPLVALSVCIGEIISASLLGTGLVSILQKRNFKL
jgi:uncharacterized membrane protein